MFTRKCFVIFISKHFIDFGWVILKKEASFQEGEAFQYTQETLVAILKRLADFSRKGIRVVLSEELVYVTELFFPKNMPVTRDSVREKAEASIPENLQKTDWDFQASRYTEQSGDEGTRVQVVAVEKSFALMLRQALEVSPLPIESILPESYLLARFEKEATGVTVIVAQDREVVVLCALRAGFVIATQVEEGEFTPDRLMAFLNFLSSTKGNKTDRLIFSHFSEAAMEPFLELSAKGYVMSAKDYNPLIGAALEKSVSGKDEEVLNINIFSSFAKKPWWRLW